MDLSQSIDTNINNKNQKSFSKNMQSEESYRRKTRSQLVDEEKQVSRPQVQSQNNLELLHPNSDIDSSKLKEQKLMPARKSNWNKKQRIRYLVFLNYYSEIPYWGSDLKSIPTYKSLSQFVKSRSPEQCKSFHLSTRRNYKSIEEEIKALQEELEMQEGYQKMLDRYQLEIIGFEQEHTILKMFELSEKEYFHNKFQQTCKETVYKKKQINRSGDSPQEPENDYNLKINIKDLIMEKQVKQNKKQDKPQHSNTYQPLINMHEFKMPQQNYLKGTKKNSQNGIKMPNLMMPNHQHSPMGIYHPQNSFNPLESNKAIDKMHMDSMRIQGANSQSAQYGARNIADHPNERIMPEGMGRMMEPNRLYGQYHNYGPYGSSPFSDINPMHLAQFRNQMPYSMPPPGGFSYMMQDYHEPYSMGNMSSRYGSKVDELSDKNNKRNQRQNVTSLSPQKNHNQKNDKTQNTVYSQRRKQLLLNCHQHFVNWLRSVTQIDRRKQMGSNLIRQ